MFRIVDAEGTILGEESDYGNAMELWMVLEEITSKSLKIVEVK